MIALLTHYRSRNQGKRGMLCTALCLALLVAACAPTTQRVEVDSEALEAERRKQQEFAVRDYLSNVERLHVINYPMTRAAEPYCPDNRRRGVGAYAVTTQSFPEGLRGIANELWNIGQQVVVIAVADDSPAARAGLQFGDVLSRVDGKAVGSGREAIDNFYQLLSSGADDIEIDLTVLRDGQPLALQMQTESVCNYLTLLVHDDSVNAFADGSNVFITTGMMRFAATDTELAIVVGHELAHNVMTHSSKKMTNYLLGSIVDIVAAIYGVNTQGMFGQAGAGAFSQEFEAEADYVGLYILDHAGHDIEQAPDFWRKMAVAHPGNIQSSLLSTHPATPERFLALGQTIEEIETKKSSGEPVRPNQKPEGGYDSPYKNQGLKER